MVATPNELFILQPLLSVRVATLCTFKRAIVCYLYLSNIGHSKTGAPADSYTLALLPGYVSL